MREVTETPANKTTFYGLGKQTAACAVCGFRLAIGPKPRTSKPEVRSNFVSAWDQVLNHVHSTRIGLYV